MSDKKLNPIKNSLLLALQLVGLNALSKIVTRKRPRIIMFHKIYPEGEQDLYSNFVTTRRFEEIVSYIAKNYNALTLKNLVGYHEKNGFYPDDAVVLTFDDGFKSFLNCALPILKKYSIPATLFVCPQLINQGGTIWPEEIYEAFENGDLAGFSRDQMLNWIVELKKLNGAARSSEIERKINSKNSKSAGKNSLLNRDLLNWAELEILLSSGLVEIGSHSLTHKVLAMESEDVARLEIEKSKKLLEEKLGQPILSFCYPNGQEGDYTEKDIVTLEKFGYRCAVTAIYGLPDSSTNLFSLPRFGGDFHSFRAARKYIDGVEFLQRRLIG